MCHYFCDGTPHNSATGLIKSRFVSTQSTNPDVRCDLIKYRRHTDGWMDGQTNGWKTARTDGDTESLRKKRELRAPIKTRQRQTGVKIHKAQRHSQSSKQLGPDRSVNLPTAVSLYWTLHA